MDTTRSEHLRKMVTGACMIAAPLVFIVSESMHPDDKTNATGEVAVIAGGLDRWYAAHALEVVGLALLVGAFIGLAHLLHERRATTAVVGGGLAILGIVGFAAAIGAEGLGGYYMVKNASNAAAVRMFDDMFNGTRLIPFFIASLLISVALIVMAVGLLRSRVIATWEGVALIVAAVVLGVAGPTGLQALALVGMVILFVGLAPIGYTVMLESDAEWEHTPDYHGLPRPSMA